MFRQNRINRHCVGEQRVGSGTLTIELLVAALSLLVLLKLNGVAGVGPHADASLRDSNSRLGERDHVFTWFYADRAARRHRHHRHSDRPFVPAIQADAKPRSEWDVKII